jgi:hypothetical protein
LQAWKGGMVSKYPQEQVQQAVEQALAYGCPHADGVTLCLRQLTALEPPLLSLDLRDHPELLAVATEAPDLACYDQLLDGRA